MLQRPETRTAIKPPHPDWQPIVMPDDYAVAAGPWFWRLQDGAVLFGMRIDERHISIRGVSHGGVLMAMADMQSIPAGYAANLIDRLVPTMTFTMDFISPARLGDWLEMRTELLKRTGKMLFTQAVIRTQAGDVVARSSATFRIVSEPDPRGLIVHQVLGLEAGA